MKLLGFEIAARAKVVGLQAAWRFYPSQATLDSVIPEKLKTATFYITVEGHLLVEDEGYVNFVPAPNVKGALLLPLEEVKAVKKTALHG